MPPSFELGKLVVRARRLVWSTAARELARAGESILTWQVMSHLETVGRCHQAELAEAIAQHPAGVSRTLEELEKKGLARREDDPEDRRRRMVVLTAQGRRWLDKFRPDVMQGVGAALSRLSPDEQETLRALLSKLLAENGTAPARSR